MEKVCQLADTGDVSCDLVQTRENPFQNDSDVLLEIMNDISCE